MLSNIEKQRRVTFLKSTLLLFPVFSPSFCSATNQLESSVAEGAAAALCTDAATGAGHRTSAGAVSYHTSRRCGRRARGPRPRTEEAPRRAWGCRMSTQRRRQRVVATPRPPAASAARCRHSTLASEAPSPAPPADPRPCTARRRSPLTHTRIR